LERNKTRLQQDIKDISSELDRALAKVSSIEKKQRAFDKILAEEEEKFERLASRLAEMVGERKAAVHEVFQVKTTLTEFEDDAEAAVKENKILVEDVADLRDQIQESNKSITEIQKAKFYLEKERNELKKLFAQKEDQLEQLEAQTIMFQLSLKKTKTDMESIIDQKEVEADTCRKTAHAQVILIQAKLEEEIRTRSDVVKQRKKTESTINDLEQSIAAQQKSLTEFAKHNKELQISIKDKAMELEQNERVCNQVSEHRLTMERRMGVCDCELDELRDAVEKAEKNRKTSQTSLAEAKENAALLTAQNTALHNQKRKLELQLQLIANEVEEAFNEAKIAMEKSKKSNYECAQLGEEFKKARDVTDILNKAKCQLDMEMKSNQERLQEQEEFNSKGSKRTTQRLTDDINDMEAKVEERRKNNEEMSKNLKKMDRKFKEAFVVLEEERKFLAKTTEDYESNKIKSRKMKNQLEEIGSQIMMFRSKSRKLASDLQDVEDKADHAEQTLNVIWGK